MSRKQKRQEIVIEQLTIESLGNEGVAIARNEEGIVHFIKHAAPGDIIKAEIRHKKKRYAEGIIREIIVPSSIRIEPVCSHAGTCGGCSWQHIGYEHQLYWKKQHTIDVFDRIGKIPYNHIADTLPSPQQLYYRNKMEFSFGSSKWLTEDQIASGEDFKKDFAFGLHIPGRFDRILDIEACYIQPKAGNAILNLIRDKALECSISAYNPRTHGGFLRTLLIRSTVANNELMCLLITQTPKDESEFLFLDWWQKEAKLLMPDITSLATVENNSLSPIAQGEITFMDGSPYITEQVLGINYQISPFSFFQTNSYQLPYLLQSIINQADIAHDDIVWDLYCGAGTISFPIAQKAKHCIAIELSQSSINDAKNNQTINEVENIEFYCFDLHKKLAIDFLQTLSKPDIIIIDPPRAGINQILLDHLLEIESPKLIYVSCNPATQARDCAILSEKYIITHIQPVDMFPHTAHIESIATLILKP